MTPGNPVEGIRFPQWRLTLRQGYQQLCGVGFSRQRSVREHLCSQSQRRRCAHRQAMGQSVHDGVSSPWVLNPWGHYHSTLQITLSVMWSSYGFYLSPQKFPSKGRNSNTWNLKTLQSLQVECLKCLYQYATSFGRISPCTKEIKESKGSLRYIWGEGPALF